MSLFECGKIPWPAMLSIRHSEFVSVQGMATLSVSYSSLCSKWSGFEFLRLWKEPSVSLASRSRHPMLRRLVLIGYKRKTKVRATSSRQSKVIRFIWRPIRTGRRLRKLDFILVNFSAFVRQVVPYLYLNCHT